MAGSWVLGLREFHLVSIPLLHYNPQKSYSFKLGRDSGNIIHFSRSISFSSFINANSSFGRQTWWGPYAIKHQGNKISQPQGDHTSLWDGWMGESPNRVSTPQHPLKWSQSRGLPTKNHLQNESGCDKPYLPPVPSKTLFWVWEADTYRASSSPSPTQPFRILAWEMEKP